MTEQQIAAVDVAAVFRFVGPTDSPAITAEQRILPQRLKIDVLRNIRKRRDEQRVLGTIEFAEEAGLAIVLPSEKASDRSRTWDDVSGSRFFCWHARPAPESQYAAHREVTTRDAGNSL